jgi:hypothetical protein
MKLRLISAPGFAALALLLGAAPLPADDIYIRISVKFIVNAAGTMPCCGNGTFDSFADITNQVNAANAILRETGRGYQFFINEVTTVGGPATNFYSNAREDKDLLEAAAEANKTGFKYRDNAINMYVNDASGSAICSFPPTDDVILFGQNSRTTSIWHERRALFQPRPHAQRGAGPQRQRHRLHQRLQVAPRTSVPTAMAAPTPSPTTSAGTHRMPSPREILG